MVKLTDSKHRISKIKYKSINKGLTAVLSYFDTSRVWWNIRSLDLIILRFKSPQSIEESTERMREVGFFGGRGMVMCEEECKGVGLKKAFASFNLRVNGCP